MLEEVDRNWIGPIQAPRQRPSLISTATGKIRVTSSNLWLGDEFGAFVSQRAHSVPQPTIGFSSNLSTLNSRQALISGRMPAALVKYCHR
jgi:hypothetical protein